MTHFPHKCFTQNNRELILQAAANEDLVEEEEHREQFDRMEERYLDVRARLSERLQLLQGANQNVQDNDESDEEQIPNGQALPNNQEQVPINEHENESTQSFGASFEC